MTNRNIYRAFGRNIYGPLGIFGSDQPDEQYEPDKIIAERDTTHGPYDRTAARAQTLKTATREGTNWSGMEPWARESLEMIEHKRARILEGNWRTEDHWLDIAGYAMLVVNLLREQK